MRRGQRSPGTQPCARCWSVAGTPIGHSRGEVPGVQGGAHRQRKQRGQVRGQDTQRPPALGNGSVLPAALPGGSGVGTGQCRAGAGQGSGTQQAQPERSAHRSQRSFLCSPGAGSSGRSRAGHRGMVKREQREDHSAEWARLQLAAEIGVPTALAWPRPAHQRGF